MLPLNGYFYAQHMKTQSKKISSIIAAFPYTDAKIKIMQHVSKIKIKLVKYNLYK